MFDQFNLLEITSTFIVLFSIIDVLGSMPIFIALEDQGRPINATKAALISWAMLATFFFAGNALLQLFHVDIQSFAVAGSIVIFMVALEMVLDVTIFKNQGPMKNATLVPVVFPLIAGAGSFTTLLALRVDYATINIMIGLGLNMVLVFIVIRSVRWIERRINEGAIYLLRKFFGIIILAISVRLFTENIVPLIEHIAQGSL